RGKLMQAAFPQGYGMAAVIGMDEVRVQELVENLGTAEHPIYISNINAPRQIVVAGSDSALAAMMTLAAENGARQGSRLAIHVPSHCPLLQPVAERLVSEMAALSLKPPKIPYINNRGGRSVYDAEAIREDLATNVAHAVRWYDTLEVLRELGTTLF